MSMSDKHEQGAKPLVYERGGADFCDAILHPNDEFEALAVLKALFDTHGLKVLGTDGSFTSKKSVSLTIYLQSKAGSVPDKSDVEAILSRHLELTPYDYVLIEASLMAKEDQVVDACLALIFQGDDAIGLARKTLPALSTLEQRMKQIVAQASGVISKIAAATGIGGLFTKKSASNKIQSPSDDSGYRRGPGR